MQAQVVHVHIYMATTITFVIYIVMKGKSPSSIMCTTTTNIIYYELKHDNDIIIMKMLHKRKCTSPNKPYFTPSPNFMTTREDRETSTTKSTLRLQQPLRHLRQVLPRHLRLLTMSSPTSTSSTTRRPPTSEGDTSIFGSPSDVGWNPIWPIFHERSGSQLRT